MSTDAIIGLVLVALLLVCFVSFDRYPKAKGDAELENFRLACADLKAEFRKALLPPVVRVTELLDAWLTRGRRL